MCRFALVTSPNIDYASWLSDSTTPRLAPYLPIGLLSIASALRHDGHAIRLIDVSEHLNERGFSGIRATDLYAAIAAECLAGDPDMVGFSTEYYTYHHVLGIARQVKAQKPGCLVVFGGPQASACDLETMGAFAEPDIIVRGEAEMTVRELAAAFDRGAGFLDVAGLTLRSEHGPQRTAPRALIGDLDELPVPAFDLVRIRPDDLVMIEAGRGCPFKCAFCSTSDFWQRRYRMKSARRICEEVQHLRDRYGVQNISLIHDCLTADKDRVIDLCETLDRAGIAIQWGCSSRTDTINPELLKRMARSGCHHIYYGLESGSAITQKLIQKNLQLSQAFDIVRASRANGIEVTTSFMMGFPGETRDRVAATFDAAYRALAEDVYLVQIFGTAPYGDTPMLSSFQHDIHYDGHFLDLPLAGEDLRGRDELMAKNPAVFSGHYRYCSEAGDNLLAGADQFFPLMNEMRYTVMAIWRELGDPLFLYDRWITWIHDRNCKGGRYAATPYYGSFESFAEFLRALAAELAHRIPYLPELVDFERTRLEVLIAGMNIPTDSYNPHLSRDLIRYHSRLKLAPNVALKAYAHDVTAIVAELRSGGHPQGRAAGDLIAFVGRDEKNVDVMRMNGFAGELLGYCELRLSVEDMVYRIRRKLQQSGAKTSDEDVERACMEGLRQLSERRLVRFEEAAYES